MRDGLCFLWDSPHNNVFLAEWRNQQISARRYGSDAGQNESPLPTCNIYFRGWPQISSRVLSFSHAQTVLWAPFPARLEAQIDVSVHLRLLHWAYWLCSFILTCSESQGKSLSAYINIGSSQRRVWRGWRGEQQAGHNGDGRERKAQRKCSDRQRN